jgi:phosphate:Na+ symporter
MAPKRPEVPMQASALLLTLLGGVALLLWSVRMVRTGMTRAFGASLRSLVGRACSNRARAFATGVGVTGLLQSATATALLLASFASRKLIALPLALALMLGADVGTALVAQVYAIDIKWVWAGLLFAGVGLFHASEKDEMRGGGRVLIGFGLMLLGLTVISQVATELRDSETLKLVLSSLGTEKIPVLAVLVAAAMTWLAHSSLAMVLFIMSLAGGGVIDERLAVALVLGANLGGAIVPFVALSGSAAAARRVVLGNLLIRAACVIIAIPFTALLVAAMATVSTGPARLAVNFHLAFNIVLAAVAFPLLGYVATFATRLLHEPAATGTDSSAPRHLDPSVLDTPSEALACAMRETLVMGDHVLEMLRRALPAIEGSDLKAVREVERSDNDVDALHEAIKLYLIRASKADMGQEDSRRYVEILTFTTNLEHIGDIIDKNLMELAVKKIKKRYAFSAEGAAELRAFHGHVVDHMRLALNVFATRDVALARRLLREKTTVRTAEFEATDRHFSRLREGRVQSIETSSIHLDVVRDLKRINSHLTSVAYPILDSAGELAQSRLLDPPSLETEPAALDHQGDPTGRPAGQ